MNIYYVAGVPYSDELYHHGIKGQKWYIRRFQNEDGSLTALGRIRYGAGNVAKKAGRGVVNAVKNRHPSLMTDDELAQRTDRLRREAEYQRQRVASGRINENNNQNREPGFFRQAFRRTGQTIIDAAVQRFADRIRGGHEIDIRDVNRGHVRAQDVQYLSTLMNTRLAAERWDLESQRLREAREYANSRELINIPGIGDIPISDLPRYKMVADIVKTMSKKGDDGDHDKKKSKDDELPVWLTDAYEMSHKLF